VATVPAEMTAVAGAVLTAAQWNTNVRDAVNFLTNPPACEIRQTVAQSIPTGGTTTALLFDVEDFDNDGMHSTASLTSRITAQTAGRFQFGGGVIFAVNGTGRRICWWALNGTAVLGSEATTMASSVANATCGPGARTKSVFLNVGDYVELIGYQDSGGALNTAVVNFEMPTVFARWIGTT
jgi:hypothetical protein